MSHSHYVFMTWLPHWELDELVVLQLQARGLPSQWPQFQPVFQHLYVKKGFMFLLTGLHTVSTFVSVTPPDIFSETSGQFQATFVVTECQITSGWVCRDQSLNMTRFLTVTKTKSVTAYLITKTPEKLHDRKKWQEKGSLTCALENNCVQRYRKSNVPSVAMHLWKWFFFFFF